MSVGPSVGWFVGRSVMLLKKLQNLLKNNRFLHVHPFIGLPAHYSVCLPIIMSVRLSIRPFVRLQPHCKIAKSIAKLTEIN